MINDKGIVRIVHIVSPFEFPYRNAIVVVVIKGLFNNVKKLKSTMGESDSIIKLKQGKPIEK